MCTGKAVNNHNNPTLWINELRQQPQQRLTFLHLVCKRNRQVYAACSTPPHPSSLKATTTYFHVLYMRRKSRQQPQQPYVMDE